MLRAFVAGSALASDSFDVQTYFDANSPAVPLV